MAKATTRRPGAPALVVGVSLFIMVILVAFIAPAINSGARDLPVAVSGSDKSVAELTATLDSQHPGVFEFTRRTNADTVVDAVKNRDAVGGISLDTDSAVVTGASGAGVAYTGLLAGAADAIAGSGREVTYDDVAPTSKQDPQGAAIAAMGFPMIIAGIVAGAIFSTIYQGSMFRRVAGIAVLALVTGMGAAALLMHGFDAFGGSYWVMGMALSLGIASVAYVDFGLSRMVGLAGMAPLAILLMFVGNPLAGLAAGPEWLPSPWGTIGQLMPPGATSTVVRSIAYFDGQGAGLAWAVLLAWTALGLAITAIVTRQERRRSAANPVAVVDGPGSDSGFQTA